MSSQVHASGAKRPDIGTDTTLTTEMSPTDSTGTGSDTGAGTTYDGPTSNAYSYVDQEGKVPRHLLTKALNFFDQNKAKLANQDYIVVIDYKQHNSKERFYLIDMVSGKAESYLVAHGKGSDPGLSGYSTKFSNTADSLMTSLGFFITGETYYGSNGFSLKLDGQSSTNSNARARAIVIHGAEYVSPGDIIGRSWGCPALEMRYHEEIIEKIKGGALVYSGV